MPKKLILHIGTEKTGTTSIQGFLNKNQSGLAEHGIALLEAPKSFNNQEIATCCQPIDADGQHFSRMKLRTAEQRLAWQQSFQAEVRKEIEAIPAHLHTVVVSSEHLHSRLHTEADVAKVKAMFDGLFDEIQVVVYLRRQDRVAVSLYSTVLRGGGIRRNVIPLGIQEDDHYYNYERLLTKWANVFGRSQVSARIFDRSHFIKSDLVSDFLATAGLAQLDGVLARPGVFNESISAEIGELLIQFNLVMKDLGQKLGHSGLDRLRVKLLTKLMARFPGEPLMPTRSEARAFYALFEPSNARLSQEWLNGQSLFDEDFSKYPEQVAPVSIPSDMVGEALKVVLNHTTAHPPKSTLETSLEGLHLQRDSFTVLRELAQTLESPLPLLALFMATLAQEKRPNGPAIKKLVGKLRQADGAETCERAWSRPSSGAKASL